MISYRLSNSSVGKLNVTKDRNQYTFGNSCAPTQNDCSPYTVELTKGIYQIEAWGSVGKRWGNNYLPGLGGYTSGILNLKGSIKLFLFVGSDSKFNYANSTYISGVLGGSATDVRLYVNENFEWFDAKSLRSRIMVAAGGGGAEWGDSIAGNGGGLEGDIGYSTLGTLSGATQIRGGKSIKKITYRQAEGMFGIAPIIQGSTDMGGLGGNGYWSGASQDYSGAGSGGSSFVSGYDGCIALKSEDSDEMSETNSSVHYSNISFENPSMQRGNTTMPLYYSRNSHGIGNNGRGCIRITILNYLFTCNYRQTSNFNFLIHVFILIYDS